MIPDRWLELTVRSELEPHAVAQLLLEMGGSAVEERSGALVSYFLPPENPDAFLGLVQHELRRIHVTGEIRLDWRWQVQEDWETLWRRGLGSRRISPRLIVVPSWEPFEPEPGELVIHLDPGMAFGTAEHATTRSCLRALDSLVTPGVRVADVGAGSGILSIAAAHLGAERILAIEMDEMACDTALENLVRNGVTERVQILRAQVGGEESLPDSPFDGIVANLQSHLLLPLFRTFRKSLRDEGWLVVSGILSTEEPGIVLAASEEGFTLQEADQEDGWWTGRFRATGGP